MLNPNTIHLSGPMIIQQMADSDDIGHYKASEVITPGHLIETHLNAGVIAVRKNSSAVNVVEMMIALNFPEYNLGIDDPYAVGDTVKIGIPNIGSVFWGLIDTGQNISAGDWLQSAGDGTVAIASDVTALAGLARFKSLDTTGLVAAPTRIRIRVAR